MLILLLLYRLHLMRLGVNRLVILLLLGSLLRLLRLKLLEELLVLRCQPCALIEGLGGLILLVRRGCHCRGCRRHVWTLYWLLLWSMVGRWLHIWGLLTLAKFSHWYARSWRLAWAQVPLRTLLMHLGRACPMAHWEMLFLYLLLGWRALQRGLWSALRRSLHLWLVVARWDSIGKGVLTSRSIASGRLAKICRSRSRHCAHFIEASRPLIMLAGARFYQLFGDFWTTGSRGHGDLRCRWDRL